MSDTKNPVPVSTSSYHKPVLIREVLEFLAPQPGKLYIDATFGGGGHTKAILDAQPDCRIIALDWDLQAIEQNGPEVTEKYGERLKLVWGNFGQLYKILKKEHITQVDGILADFGTSQFQIHQRAGFSFQTNTPLDMRMSPSHQTITAAHIVNQSSEEELVHIFQEYGQEQQSKTIARKIIEVRKKIPITTTKDLVEIIESLINPRAFKAKRGIHPATQVFQALRIAVNSELEHIHSFLIAGLRFLAPKGRFVCISFHSLEDRMVKNFFKENVGLLNLITTKPAIAKDDELIQNASSRSAKLRAAEKI